MKKVLILVMFIGFSNILYAQSTYFEVQGGIWLDPATIVKTIEFNKLTECNFVEGKLNYCYSGPTYNCSQAPYLRIEKWSVKYIVDPMIGSISTHYSTLLSSEIVTYSKFPALKMLYGTLDDLYFTSGINDISYRITLYDDGIYSDEKGRPWIVFYSEVPENTTKADAYTHNSTKYIIPRIMLNDAIKNTNKKLFERAAFFADYFTSNYDANKPDNYSTTTSTGWFCEELGIPVTSMEHFMDPISHRGYGPLNLAGLEVFPRYKSAGNKCQEYYNTALSEYANGNIDIAVQHLTWGLHFVQDACIPLHDDPVWGTADEDVVEAMNRAKYYHKPAEDVLCAMINSPLFSNYRYEGGKYEITDPHGSGVTAFSWVDANAHKFYDLRPLSDNVLFPPADDIMVVANEVAPYFWATSTGFVNYFCNNVSGCPIGAKNDVSYPPYHFSKEPGPSDANEITFIWSGGSDQTFRLYFWPYNQLPTTANLQMIQIHEGFWPSMPNYTLTTANGLPVDWINYRFAITNIDYWGFETDFSRTYCYQEVCPTNFYGTVMTPSQIKLQWTDNNDNEDAFLVWCSTDPNNFPEQPTVTVDPIPDIYGKGECIVSGLAQSQIYYFMVKARRPTGLTNCATTEVNMAEPGIPTIRCEIMSGGPGGWEAGFLGPVVTANTEPNMNAGTTTTIEIERKTGANGLWQLISQESIFTRSGNIYLDEVAFSQDYWYRARAVNGIAASVYTPECNITRYQLYLKAPTITDVTTDGHSIHVEWCDTTRSEYMDGYRIYWKKATETLWNSTSSYDNGYMNSDYIWGPLEPLTTYQVRMTRYYYKPAPEGLETEPSPINAIMTPIIGVTGWNSSRHLVRTNDKSLVVSIYTDNLSKCCQSKNNGLSWDISQQIFQTTNNAAVATAPSGKIYTFRPFGNELFIDSLISGETTIEYHGTEKVPNAYCTSVCQPAIAIDESGRLHCLWTAHVDYTNYLYYAKRENGIWSMPLEIYRNSPPPWDMYYVSPTVVVSASGDIHIAWSSTTTNGIGRTYSVVLYSMNLGAPIILAGSDLNNVKYPILAISSKNIIALSWQQGNYDPISGQENMEIFRRVKIGENWNTPYNVSNNTGASQMPMASYDNEGTLHLLWFDNSTTGFTQAVYTSYEPAKSPGIAIDNAVLENGGALIWSNQKATDNAKTLSIMPTEEDVTIIDPTQIFYRRYKNNSWSPIYRLTASAAPSVQPSLPLTDDAAQIGFIWTEGNGVKYKRLPDLDAPMVAVTYPNGGEMLYSGRRYNITWSSADNRGLKEYVLYYTTNYLIQDEPAIDAATLWHSVATVPGNLNSYSWRVPYNVASTACRFKIVAYDSSGNIATDISDKNFTIKSRDIAVVVTDKAIAYNNAGKIARSSDGLLHVCYNGIDSVYYMASSDDGQTWPTSLALDEGSLPTIATDSKNMPAMAWIKQWDNIAGGGVFYSRQTAAGWTAPETLAYMQGVLWDYIGGYSPPAMTIKNDTVSIVYEYSYGGGIPPHIAKGWALHHARFAVNNVGGKKDTTIDSYTEIINPPIWQTPASASIATDYKGYDHISWHRTDKVYYRIRKPDGNYGNIVQLSGMGIAQNPCISISGVASAVWVEEGDIYQRTGFDQKWAAAVNVSASGANSMMPYICGSDVLWTEDVLSDYEVYLSSYSTAKMTYDVSENLSCTDYASIFPHETKLQTNEGTKTYRIWAEEIQPAVLWGLTFMADTTELEPTYALDAGQAEPSIFTVQRDGYITYGTKAKAKSTVTEPFKTVDYDTTALIYSFDNFDPDKKYKITLSFYQETGQEIKLKPIVNKQPLGEIKLTSGEEAILDKPLPEASYKDGQVILTIEKVKGPIAVCGKILIYENPTGQGHGGAQSEEITSITLNYINKLYQNCPNPFSRKTSFNYQIKNQGQVTFKVYNALGQLVKTLVNETKPAGAYQVEWDGKDGCGLKVSSGVYIYRLQTGDFMETKKMMVIK